MKTSACVVIAALVLAGCNSSQQEQRLADLAIKDSTLMVESQKKDSSITAYIKSINEIQDNLDNIKKREKILSMQSEGSSLNGNALSDIKSIDKLILKDNREIAVLEGKLKKLGGKNADMQKMLDHLTAEVAEKDNELAALQASLATANDNLKTITQQFNDSLATMNVQREVNSSLTTQMNTVYYAVGTVKELKKSGVIEQHGGILGVGSTPTLKHGFNANYFTKADKTKLSSIALYSKFSQVVTDQPSDAFKVQGSLKSDSLKITDANAFWSESKYLVVVVK